MYLFFFFWYQLDSCHASSIAYEAFLHWEFRVSFSPTVHLDSFHERPSKCWPRDSVQVLHLLEIFLNMWQSSCLEMLVVFVWIFSFRSYKEFRLSVVPLTHNNCLGLSLETLQGHTPLVINHLPNAFAREAIGKLAVWATALSWIK